MSPERIRNESYTFPADIWSIGLALLEYGTGEFPYTSSEGPANLMMQLLLHPFITKYETAKEDLAGFVRSVFDPTQRMKDLENELCFLEADPNTPSSRFYFHVIFNLIM